MNEARREPLLLLAATTIAQLTLSRRHDSELRRLEAACGPADVAQPDPGSRV